MKFNVHKNVIYIAEIGLIAAIYAVLTISLSFMSYGLFQVRIAEALIVVVAFRKHAGYGIIIGCLIANILSPIGIQDIIFGTLATAISVFLAIKLRKKKIYWMVLPTVVINAIMIGILLAVFYQINFLIGGSLVLAGEVVSVYIVGLPFYYALKRVGFKKDYS